MQGSYQLADRPRTRRVAWSGAQAVLIESFLAILCFLSMLGFPLLVIGQYALQFYRGYQRMVALEDWARRHGAEFRRGVTRKDDPLFVAIAERMSLEPDPCTPIRFTIVWDAGRGERDGREYWFFIHCPGRTGGAAGTARTVRPNTLRLLVPCTTALPEGSCLCISPSTLRVFVDGLLSKPDLPTLSPPTGWAWSHLQSSGPADVRGWLTQDRATPIEALLDSRYALQVYPQMLVLMSLDPRDDTWLDEVLSPALSLAQTLEASTG